jgi:hypothetical protein
MRLFKPKATPDDVTRCPECGERVPTGVDDCAMCGHHLADPVDAVQAGSN